MGVTDWKLPTGISISIPGGISSSGLSSYKVRCVRTSVYAATLRIGAIASTCLCRLDDRLWRMEDLPGTIKFSDLFNLNLLSLANVKYVISTVPLADPDLVLLPSTIRDTQLQWRQKPKLSRYLDVVRGRSPGTPLYIYENQRVLPRFFVRSASSGGPPRTP